MIGAVFFGSTNLDRFHRYQRGPMNAASRLRTSGDEPVHGERCAPRGSYPANEPLLVAGNDPAASCEGANHGNVSTTFPARTHSSTSLAVNFHSRPTLWAGNCFRSIHL